jgi:thiosulfate/3-mercaptopyruvate sulfurtransferase
MTVRSLVSIDELFEHLDESAWVVIDCRFVLSDPLAGRSMYDAGHIVGARYADLGRDLSAPPSEFSGRHPLPETSKWASQLGKWGIDRDTQVVAYDQLGGPLAARFWWLMRWIGHTSVAVLDGGFPGWVKANYPVSGDSPTVDGKHPYQAAFRHDLWVSTADVEELVAADMPKRAVVDARAGARYRGETEPIDPIAGHIPSALSRPFTDNLDTDGCFLEADELRARFENLTEDPGDIVHMCGSGVTACHNLLAMEHTGLKGSKLYVGSWSEWTRGGRRPVETGRENGIASR